MSQLISGKGVFCFPAINVSENMIPAQLGRITNHQRKIIFDKKINENIRILVTDDGFFCPSNLVIDSL